VTRRRSRGGLRSAERLLVAVLVAGAVLAIYPEAAPAAASRAAGRGVTGQDPSWLAREFGHGPDTSAGMAMSPNGSVVFVAAASSGRFGVAAHDTATGAALWSVHVPRAPRDLAEFAEAMTVSPDGARVFVTGDAEETVDTRSIVTVALDASTGALVWRSRVSVGQGNQAIPNGLAIAPDGSRLYVIAARSGAGGSDFWDYLTAAVDTSDGSTQWKATFAGKAGRADIPRGVGVSPDGARVFVTGTSIGVSTGRDIVTVAYAAAAGHRAWLSRTGGPLDDEAAGLAVTPDAKFVYVSGTLRANTPDADVMTVVLGTDGGGTIRRLRFDSGAEDVAKAVTVTGDGAHAFVVGESDGDFVTLSYGVARDPLWTAMFGRAGLTDAAAAVATSPDGARVYVAGRSENGVFSCEGDVIGAVYAIVAYDAAGGHEAWSATYKGESKRDPDSATSVAVGSAGGSVFVSGTSDEGCRSAPEVATLAYSA
jgi:DNA-binding beta-propeller fold protein YncE